MTDSPDRADAEVQRTALYDSHVAAGGRMVSFAGWELPVRYSDVADEHRAVRTAAGLFDVSHMGEVRVSGADAEAFLDHLTPNHVAKLAAGRAHYSGLLTERGTYIDDILIYRLASDEFLIVVNASNIDKDVAWIEKQAAAYSEKHEAADCRVENVSDQYALLALQGPRASQILAPNTDVALDELRYYGFARGTAFGIDAIISRTGYTGEDGFELYLAPAEAPGMWRQLLAAGASDGLVPAGLGARDTLRLEAGMALYGHEIDDTRTPYDAGLGWVVKMAKGAFIGREHLVVQKAAGTAVKLVGFEVEGRGIAREGATVQVDGEAVGEVTSGTFAPTLEKAIGTAYVPASLAEPGTEISLQVRRRTLSARVVTMPFYKRPRSS